MSIKITKKEGKTTIVELSNGHSKAVADIMHRWRIKDEESAIGFALSILMSGDEPTIYAVENGNPVKIEPNENIRK